MSFGNIINQFLNKYGFTHTRAAKKPDFSPFGVRLNQVNHFDACKKYLSGGGKVFKLGWLAVNGISALFVQLFHAVNGVADNIEQTSFNLFADRHGNGCAEGFGG